MFVFRFLATFLFFFTISSAIHRHTEGVKSIALMKKNMVSIMHAWSILDLAQLSECGKRGDKTRDGREQTWENTNNP